MATASQRVEAVEASPTRVSNHTGKGVRIDSVVVMAMLFVVAIYFLLPFYWLLVSATKTSSDLFGTYGLWFAPHFNLFANIQQVFTYDDAHYGRWLFNSFFYASVSAFLGTFFSAMAGYALAKFVFPGRTIIFSIILGSVLVPAPALVLPLYLLMSGVHLTNTIWAIILPSVVNPFGVYLARIYIASSVPDVLLDAARVDGAGEFNIFLTVVLRLLAPALVTIFLFQFVAVWTNFFLQYVMVSDTSLFPVTVGLQSWNTSYTSAGAVQNVYSAIVTGALLSVVPLIIGFLLLQRYWRNGLALGSLAN
jgi:multiple sugar transport system permease protein